MSEEIIIAIISAIGVVLAALIGGIFSVVKNNRDSKNNTKIKQNQKGKYNTQVGIQNNYERGDK